MAGDVDKAAAPRRQIGFLAEFRDVDIALHIHLHERQEGHVKAAALKIGELAGRRHEGVGVRRAAESKAGQRHPPHRTLFDGPGDGLRMARLQQDAGHHGGNAEAEVGGHAVAQFHRGAAGDDLFDAVLGHVERRPGTHDLAGNGGVIGGFGGLFLVRIQHDQIDQMPRHPHVVRAQGPRCRQAFDLRNHQTAVVAHSDGLIQTAEISALMFVGQIAALVRRGGAQDADIGNDVWKVEPGVAAEGFAADNRRGGGAGIHRAAFALWIDKRVKADLGQHPRAAGGDVAVHVKEDARGDVVGSDAVFHHHRPDRRHRQAGGARGVGSRDDPRQQPVLCQMVNALDAVHVARRDRADDGQVSGKAVPGEPRADGGQHHVRAPERGRRRDGQHRGIGNLQGRFRRAHQFRPRCT